MKKTLATTVKEYNKLQTKNIKEIYETRIRSIKVGSDYKCTSGVSLEYYARSGDLQNLGW